MLSNENNSLVPLVRHEFRRRRGAKKRRSMNKQWRRFYLGFFIIAALIVSTYLSLSYRIDLKAVWNFDWAVPWIIFGLSIGAVKHEWVGETAGWWLSLPYSRRRLVNAKFFAMVGRGILIAVSAFVLIAIFGGYAALISHSLTFADFQSFILKGSYFLAVVIGLTPLAAGAGITYGVISRSTWRHAIWLFWAIWILSWSIISSSGNLGIFVYPFDRYPAYFALFSGIAVSWLISWLLLLLSAYMLERYLDL